MKLYNTMSRKVETIEPLKKGKIGLYACGPTVYDYTHIGHLRKYTMDDVLIRTLRHADYQVTFVQNITDVGHLSSDADTGEDKMEKGAQKYGQTVWDVAKKFTDFFFMSMDTMGNVRPDVSAAVTDHIEEQLDLVKRLEDKGFTYIIEGDGVYFDTAKLDDYGKLARLKLENQKEGARVEKVAGKRNPTDFALWKFERPGENRAMSWPSPWAEKSFPGWHIECSALGMKYLGEQFDIHTGGIDHIPVHHTNEIAQAEAATGKKPFVKYWVHHNFLRVEGEKMSKSLNNFFTIEDVINKGFSAKALRLLYLGSHYRSEMNFTWKSLAAAQKAWQRLLDKYHQLVEQHQSHEELPLSDGGQSYYSRFFSYMYDDLKTPESVAVLWEMVKDETLSDQEKLALLHEFDSVLGFDLASEELSSSKEIQIPSQVQLLLEKRSQARQEKDWEEADKMRNQIEELGYLVKDTSQGQMVKSKNERS